MLSGSGGYVFVGRCICTCHRGITKSVAGSTKGGDFRDLLGVIRARARGLAGESLARRTGGNVCSFLTCRLDVLFAGDGVGSGSVRHLGSLG